MPVISAKTLQTKVKATKSEIAEVDTQLLAMHERWEALQTRLNTLLELLRELEPDAPELPLGQSKNLSEAALDYIAAHPGTKAADVVNALIFIPTTAKDPKKNLHQTIINLRVRGKIKKTPEGGLVVIGSNGNGTAPNP